MLLFFCVSLDRFGFILSKLVLLDLLFTARCYASAVLAMGLCPSIPLSVTSRCSIETAERIELVFGI